VSEENGVKSKTRLLEELLEERIYKPECNVNYLADVLGITPQYVYDLTRHKFKTNPQTLIETKRLAYSLEQLVDATRVDLYSVSEESGFANYHSFRRALKRRTGFSPSQVALEVSRAKCKKKLKSVLYEKLHYKVCRQHKRLS